MKALKIITTVVLSVLLLGAGLAAETLALLQTTVLEPDFYGANGREAYGLIGDLVVEKMADAVLERAPAIVLRTDDREKALELARQALPPAKVAAMLEESGPDIARYLLYGGNIPVLKGSADFNRGMADVVRGMLMDGVWDMLPDKPSFPAFMPFTPEWNLGYGQSLPDQLWLTRHYAGLVGYVLWLAIAAVALFTGLLCLTWLRDRKPFLATIASLLAANGLLLLAAAIVTSYCTADLAGEAARLYPVSLAVDLFGQDWLALFRAVTTPFRDIIFLMSVASLSLAIAAAAAGIERKDPSWPWATAMPYQPDSQPPAARRRGPRHAKSASRSLCAR